MVEERFAPSGALELVADGTRKLLLARHRTEEAKELLTQCATIQVEEAEPRQHFLLTRAWLEHESGDLEKAFESIEAASEVFGTRSRAGRSFVGGAAH